MRTVALFSSTPIGILLSSSVIPLGSAGYITPPVPVSERPADASKSGMSRAGPKVFLRPDHGRIDGGVARLLRGPFPRTGSCDARGRPRPRSLGTTERLVSALPRGIAGSGSPRRERVRRPHDAAGAGLAREGRRPRARVAVVSGVLPLPPHRAAFPPARSRLDLLSLPDFR